MTRRAWFAPVLIFVVCWSLTTRGKYTCSGDEPHYLMICQSLWADGDLDVANNYREGQSERFGVGGLDMGSHVRPDRFGAALPVHDIGVAVALAPIYAAATRVSSFAPEDVLKRFRMNRGQFAYSLISLFIVALVALAAALSRAALVAAGATASTASVIIVVLWLSPPILTNSFVVFPEAFALLATSVAVLVAARGNRASIRVDWLLLTSALGLLPWFHRKYAIYALALLLAVAWQRRHELARLPKADRWLSIALFVAPQLLLAAWSYEHWRNIGGPLVAQGHLFSSDTFTTGVLGLLVDRENGLLAWAPIYLFLPAAWMLAGRKHAPWLAAVCYLFILSSAHLQWWAGFSPAGRFLVPLVPVFACVAARAVRNRAVLYASAALLVPQVLVLVFGWQHARALWPQGNGHNPVLARLLGGVGLPESVLPSLRTLPHDTARAWTLLAAILILNAAILVVSRRKAVAMPSSEGASRRTEARQM